MSRRKVLLDCEDKQKSPGGFLLLLLLFFISGMFTGTEALGLSGYMWKQVVRKHFYDIHVAVFIVYEGCEVYNTAGFMSEVKL